MATKIAIFQDCGPVFGVGDTFDAALADARANGCEVESDEVEWYGRELAGTPIVWARITDECAARVNGGSPEAYDVERVPARTGAWTLV